MREVIYNESERLPWFANRKAGILLKESGWGESGRGHTHSVHSYSN